MERLIGFDPQLLFETAVTGVNIFFLFFILSYLIFNPAKEVLRKRREKVATELENAATKESEALALKAEYEKKLSEVNKEAELILEDARKRAKLRESEIIEEAKKQSAIIIERADKEIELEKRKALDDLKSEVVSIASLIASKAVGMSLNVEIQDALVDETLKEMGEDIGQS